MARVQDTSFKDDFQGYLLDDPEFLPGIFREVLQRLLEEKFIQHLNAGPYERTDGRQGYRNGSYTRILQTRVGRLALSIPRDRDGTFRHDLFEQFSRSERALELSLMEMVIHGVSTRKVTKITEELCGTSFSKSFVSRLSTDLDTHLQSWRERRLDKCYPYLYVDALYERVRIDGRVRKCAVLIVVGVDEDGYRSVLSVKVCHSENESDYGDLFENLKDRGLRGVQLVISDDHRGLVNAISRHFQGASWQRCQVHFLRNFVSRLRKRDQSSYAKQLGDVFTAPDRSSAEDRLSHLLDSLSDRYAAVADWLESNIEDAFTVFDFPKEHFRRIRSTNGLERLNEEIRRRTRVVRIFPNAASCLRLTSSLCQEQDEAWGTGHRYLDMSLLGDAGGVVTGKSTIPAA